MSMCGYTYIYIYIGIYIYIYIHTHYEFTLFGSTKRWAARPTGSCRLMHLRVDFCFI